jgi:hypothetical protein
MSLSTQTRLESTFPQGTHNALPRMVRDVCKEQEQAISAFHCWHFQNNDGEYTDADECLPSGSDL